MATAARRAPSKLQLALDLKQVAGCDIFVGNEDAVGRTPSGQLFGGQVLAQAFMAAQRTVPEGYAAHALHGLFLLIGTSGIELLLEVDRVRDGQSFVTRNVKVKQKNRTIFQMAVSFHRPEYGPWFQTPFIPHSRGFDEGHIPTPEELLAQGVQVERTEAADVQGDIEKLLIKQGGWWTLHWVRHAAALLNPPPGLDEGIFAWMSNTSILKTVWRPLLEQGFHFTMAASLDHTIHFHGPSFQIDEWLMFSLQTTVSSGARGLARLEVFTKDRVLVATATQEVLLRVSKAMAQEEMKKRLAAEGGGEAVVAGAKSRL